MAVALLIALGAGAAGAQQAPLTVPAGVLRLDLAAATSVWSGSLPGATTPVSDAHTSRLTGTLGLALGLTDRVTLFGRMPFERVRVQATPLDPETAVGGESAIGPGDAEAGVALRLVGSAMPMPTARVEVAAVARLPTGQLHAATPFYRLETGDGQTDLDLVARVELPAGGVGLRLEGAYTLQFGTTNLGVEPEPYATVAAVPWLRLADGLALELGGRQLVRADDAGGGSTAIVGGLAYFGRGGFRTAAGALPIAGWWTVSKVIAADDGAPRPLGVNAELRIYTGLFR